MRRDPQEFMLAGLMEATVCTTADWRYFTDSLMSIAGQRVKLGMLGLSIHLDPELFPDARDTLSKTVFSMKEALVGPTGRLQVLNQKRPRRPMEHYQELARRAAGWIRDQHGLASVTWVTLIPHRGIWHPERATEMATAVAMTRPGNGLDHVRISTIAFLESTVDAPGAPRLTADGGLSAQDVEDAVHSGALKVMVGQREMHSRWISEAHDLVVPLRLAQEYFGCSPLGKRQYLISTNRFADSHFSVWARTYGGGEYKSIFPDVKHWLLYWRREPDDEAVAHVACAGKEEVVPIRAVRGLGENALEEHAELVAEMWELEQFKQPAAMVRQTQAEMLGTEESRLRQRYLALCAEACIRRHKAMHEFIKTQ